MSFYFLVIDGELKGQRFDLRSGLTLGRSQADIVLNDSKVSASHARIIEEGGQLYILDNGSTNGVKVAGQRVARQLLAPGVVVQVGRTFLEVKSNEEPKIQPAPPPPPPPSIPTEPSAAKDQQQPPLPPITRGAIPSPPAPELEIDEPSWDEALEEYSESLTQEVKNLPLPVAALTPAVELKFFRGLQVETTWTLGYGPRKIGASSYELPIFEPGAPDTCFEILPDEKGPRFQTDHPRQVFLNGQPVSSEILKDGDVVSFNETFIEVKLLK